MGFSDRAAALAVERDVEAENIGGFVDEQTH